MDQNEPIFSGAEVVYTNQKPPPPNPLRRPKIRYGKMIAAVLLYLAVLIPGCIGAEHLFRFGWIAAAVLWTVLYGLLIGKKAIIWSVRVYQHYAPDKVRLRCVYQPSCSEYMILALEKYGLFVGLRKGIRRLDRCHPPNGGIDFP